MAASFQPADDAPMSELNTTPLIDVMLVLLIMFIITIPISSHKVPLELPVGTPGPEPMIHRLTLDAAGRTFWDGEAVDPRGLSARLAAHVADPAAPMLQVSAEAETRYERFDEVLAAVRRAGVANLVLDNARFAGAVDGG
jgi:biopolymer transport protein ExbD